MTISKFIFNLLILITMLAFIAQFFIEFSTLNIASSMIILVSAFLTIFYIRWSTALETHPLSSFTIFGFCFTTTLGALWIQSFSWISVAENLREPLVTLTWLTIFQATAIIAHCVYRTKATSSPNQNAGVLLRLFDWMGLYDIPSSATLWGLGVLGLFSLLLSKVFPVANGLSFLAWSPFLIPYFYSQKNEAYCNIRKESFLILLHMALIVLLALLFNARGPLFLGLATVIMVFLLDFMRSRRNLSSVMFFRFVVVILIASAISIPASNIATSMTLARNERGIISPIKLFSNTIENFNSPEKLEFYREQEKTKAVFSIYNETYISNPIFNRLVNTQRHDTQIYYAGLINDRSYYEIMHKSVDYLWGVLPQPFLDVLKIDIDKRYLVVSVGDVIAHYAVGTPLGGLRTGSVFAQGLVLFGNLSVLLYFALCIIIFATIDIFSKRGPDGIVVISVIGLLNLWQNFIYGITADSFHHLFIAVVRGVLQSALLYAIAIFIVKFINKAFSLKVKSQRS